MKNMLFLIVALFTVFVCNGQSTGFEAGNFQLSRKLRVSVSTGVGYRIAKVAPQYKGQVPEYFKEIRLGPEFNTDASYFFPSGLGLGLKFFTFSSAGAMRSPPNIASNITINYFGPILYQNINLNAVRSRLMYGVSLGYTGYKDDGFTLSEKFLMKGNTIGGLLELAYDFRIYKSLYIGVNTGLSAGTLSRTNVNGVEKDLEKENRENLSRVFGNIGLRFIR